MKIEKEIVLRLSSNIIGNRNDKTIFPNELLLTNKQVKNICQAFASNSSIDIKLSKSQLSKVIQSGVFLGRLIGPLLKTRLPLVKNVIKPLAKSVLIPFGLTAAASTVVPGIHKKILGSSNNTTTLIVSNDETENMKIVKSLEDSVLLIKGVSETVQREAKEQKGEFLSMLLGTLGASLSGNMLAGKGTTRSGYGFEIGKGSIEADYESKLDCYYCLIL